MGLLSDEAESDWRGASADDRLLLTIGDTTNVTTGVATYAE